jgi:Ca-activated chloride channel family protein
MLVVRDERFEELAIKRTNRDRLAVEKTAQDERRAQKVRSVRVDTDKPMFVSPAPSHSGNGSGNAGLVGLAIALAMLLFGRHAIALSRS